jgi:hypothetical protein
MCFGFAVQIPIAPTAALAVAATEQMCHSRVCSRCICAQSAHLRSAKQPTPLPWAAPDFQMLIHCTLAGRCEDANAAAKHAAARGARLGNAGVHMAAKLGFRAAAVNMRHSKGSCRGSMHCQQSDLVKHKAWYCENDRHTSASWM